MRSQRKFEESLEGCRFIFRCDFFMICYDMKDDHQCQLSAKCFELQMLAQKIRRMNKAGDTVFRKIPFFLFLYYEERYSIFLPFGKWNEIVGRNWISNFLCSRLSPVNPVFTLPGMRLNWTSRPHQLYQRYMRIYNENLTEEEKLIIERENLRTDTHRGPEWDCFAEAFWKLLQFR